VTEKRRNPGPARRTLDAASVTPLSEAPASAAPVAWGALAILAPLGADRFGERFRALDPELGREVVLHLRAPSVGDDVREDRFLDEARRLTKIHHANALELLGADRRDGRLGYWSESYQGTTLEERVARDGPFEPGEVRRIGLELCRALTAIHAVGIIHREVRTTNVLRLEGGRVVLLDSGALGDLPPGREEAPADALRTLRASAPERLSGEGVSLSTDLFGLGVLLYRLVTGRDPFEAASAEELDQQHRHHQFVPLRERRPALPLDFVRVIEKAIDPEPPRRYSNAPAFERALAATLMAPMLEPAPEPEVRGGVAGLAQWRPAALALTSFAFGTGIALMLLAEPNRSTAPPAATTDAATVAPAGGTGRPAPTLTGPPAPAAAHPRGARVPAGTTAEEPEEHWTYKPIPHTDPTAPPAARATRAAAPHPQSPAVAGATEVLRRLAEGPRMTTDQPAAAGPFAYLTISSVPDHAAVTIDGVHQPELTNATYRVTPGEHWVLVEKRGYEPQQMTPLDLKPGEKLSASVTLAAAPPDSSAAP